MPEFRTSRGEMDTAGIDTACLPGLDMKFVPQRADEGEADQIFISLSAAPPNALGRALEAADRSALRAQGPARRRWARSRGRRLTPPGGEDGLHRNAGRPCTLRLFAP
jgi:hypothetical protein